VTIDNLKEHIKTIGMIQDIQTIWPDKSFNSSLYFAGGRKSMSSKVIVDDTSTLDYKLQHGINIGKP